MLGTALHQALIASGRATLQLVRRNPVGEGQLQWNPTASSAISNSARLAGLDAAIHLGGANLAGHRWTAAWKREIRLSRVDSTRALARALVALPQPPHTLLVASAVGIYGDRGDELLDENSQVGKGFLADVCQEWEAATEPARQAGIRVVHLRFGVVLHPATGALAKMLPLFRLGLGGRLGSGRQWMSWITLVDAVSAILFALDTASLDGPVNLAAPEPVTNTEFTRALSRAVHRPAILPAPAFALRLALGQMADEALLASARAVPFRLLSAGFQFAHPTIDSALAAAG
jgi:uncharacterized protein (TIGR01777 family)